MAKVDCSELSNILTELSMNIASTKDVRDIDEIVMEIQKNFPLVRRQDIIDAIVEATTGQAKKVDELEKKLGEIKKEAKSDKNLQKKIDQFNKYLETGDLPSKPKDKKEVPMAISELKKTAKNLNKWVATSDPAMTEKLQKKLDTLNEKLESDNIEPTRRLNLKLHENLQPIQDAIERVQAKIADVKTISTLEKQIDTLNKHLEEGTLPPKAERVKVERSEAIELLRDIRDDLQVKLDKSEPAIKLKLEKQIADLEQRIKTGDIHPRIKPEKPLLSKELQRLEYERDSLRTDIQYQLYKLKPKSVWEHIAEPFNTVKIIMTTGEFSLVLRQGGWNAYSEIGRLVTGKNPLSTAKGVGRMLQAFSSDKKSYEVMQSILNRPNAPLYERQKLLSKIDGSARLSEMEEIYMSHWTYKVPVIKNFQRAGIVFLNSIRADNFDTMYKTLGKGGDLNANEIEVIGNYIRVTTGKGNLGQIERASGVLGTVFFAPHYAVSRFQLLMGQPLWHGEKEGTAGARKLIAAEYARMFIGMATVYSLGVAAGGEVETDPTTADFGKLRFGNTRLDPLMGLSQATVFGSRFVGGSWATITGERDDWNKTHSEDFVWRFIRSKLSPAFSTSIDLATGKNVIGQKVTIGGMAMNMTHPITYGDIYDSMKEQGLEEGLALSVLTFFGMGLQTYEQRSQYKFK
jgi:hypothetical protein